MDAVRNVTRSPLVRLSFVLIAMALILFSGLISGVLATNVVSVIALILLVRGLEGRPLQSIGFGWPGLGRNLGLGLLLGAGAMLATAGVLALGGWYRIEAVAWGDPAAAGALAGAAFVYLLVGLGEEALMRGGLMRILEEWHGTAGALLLSALVFGLFHQAGTLRDRLFLALSIGLLFGAVYVATRSLWAAVGLHWAWNFTQGPLLGLSVSGGSDWSLLRPVVDGPALITGGAFGAEGSVVTVVVCLALTALLLRWAHRRGRIRPGGQDG